MLYHCEPEVEDKLLSHKIFLSHGKKLINSKQSVIDLQVAIDFNTGRSLQFERNLWETTNTAPFCQNAFCQMWLHSNLKLRFCNARKTLSFLHSEKRCSLIFSNTDLTSDCVFVFWKAMLQVGDSGRFDLNDFISGWFEPFMQINTNNKFWKVRRSNERCIVPFNTWRTRFLAADFMRLYWHIVLFVVAKNCLNHQAIIIQKQTATIQINTPVHIQNSLNIQCFESSVSNQTCS